MQCSSQVTGHVNRQKVDPTSFPVLAFTMIHLTILARSPEILNEVVPLVYSYIEIEQRGRQQTVNPLED